MRKVGFSVVFYDQCKDSFYEDILGNMLDAGVNAIELNFPQQYERVLGGTLLKLIQQFDYRAVHSQRLVSPDESKAEITRCQRVLQATDAHALTVHPDSMRTWGWLAVAFDGLAEPENMDRSKPFGSQPEDMARVFQELPNARMTIDTQHLLTLNNQEAAHQAAHALHGPGMPQVGHYHLSGLHGLQHVGLDTVPETQLTTQFSWLLDPEAPLILETRGTIREKDANGVEHVHYDLVEWETDYKLALSYLDTPSNAR